MKAFTVCKNVCKELCVFFKGKGKETTYWLKGVTGKKYNLPTPPTA